MKPHPDLNGKRRFVPPPLSPHRYPSLTEDFEMRRPPPRWREVPEAESPRVSGDSLSTEAHRFPYIRLLALLAIIAIIAALASRR